jgi:type VI secretion system protein VasD
VIRPGETRKVTLMPNPGVRGGGMAGRFREFDRALWRVVAPIAERGLTRLAISNSGTRAAQYPS